MPVPKDRLKKYIEHEDCFDDFDLEELLEDEDFEEEDEQNYGSDDDNTESNKITETNTSEDNESDENNDKDSVPEESVPEQSQPTAKPNNSYRGYRFNGYRVPSLTPEGAEIVRRYGFNEENLSNYCLAKNTFYEYIRGDGEDFVFRKEWGFPHSGSYIGYIMNCSQSSRNSDEYYVEFLANNYDICLFKFTATFRDAVYNGVKRDFGWTHSIFRQTDYSCLKGYLVLISVENIILESGNVFSKITEFKLVDERMTGVIENLIGDMLRQ